MKKFLPYYKLFKPVRLQFILGIICGLLAGISSGAGLPLISRYAFPLIFKSKETGQVAETPDWMLKITSFIGIDVPTPDQVLLVACSLLPAIFIIRNLTRYANSLLMSYAGMYVLEELRIMTFDRLQRLPLAFHKRHKEGDVLTRVMGDTSQIRQALFKVASDMLIQPVQLISAVGAVIYMSVTTDGMVYILYAIASIPVCVFPIRFLGKALYRKARDTRAKGGDITAIVSENLASQQEVRAYGMEDGQVEKFRADSVIMRGLQLKMVKYQSLISPSVEVMSTLGIVFAIYIGAQQGFTLEVFTPILLALYFAYEPVKKLGAISTSIRKAEASLERVEYILHSEDSMPEPENPELMENVQGEVCFSKVNFSYDSDPILADIDLNVQAGETVALVGPSGAGKSTFVSLLPRFYDVSEGSLTIDGCDVRDVSKRNLRDNIAIVSQNPLLFRGTIADNIRIGKPGASDDEVIAAAKHAHAHDFIMEFPEGYNNAVGERGDGLSGGQKQRVAIARAFLKDAPILILDEATSALDTESESQIQQALKELTKGRTTFVIAHRFSSIRDAQRILVFNKYQDGGRIVGDGSHEELYENCPLYKDLYDKQSG
ncbi:ABC transporter ATP-binding protein [Rubritalea sp.]|uniref:ABC transporter ATP-binding protein n=1 Tax=Rubritalea sp. TaxID=2109375 RepID=UPI003EF7BACA